MVILKTIECLFAKLSDLHHVERVSGRYVTPKKIMDGLYRTERKVIVKSTCPFYKSKLVTKVVKTKKICFCFFIVIF